jgi:hypothetical protein
MSDMSRPGPLPTAPDHELHDALLVAQFASGDPLDPDQQRLAQQIVSSCGACASLAADLRSVSGAVAWEPTPRRRRDFRISPEQAEELRGNAVTRFMRRLALPQSRGLRPAAAGVMSLGLLFLVAGTAWPGDTVELASVDEAAAPQPVATTPVIEQPQEPAAEAAELLEETLGGAADLGQFADSVETSAAGVDPDAPAADEGDADAPAAVEGDPDVPAAAVSAPDVASKAARSAETEASGDDRALAREASETQEDETRGLEGEALEFRAGETEMAPGLDPETTDQVGSFYQSDALGAIGADRAEPPADGARLQDVDTVPASDGLDAVGAVGEPADGGIDIETALILLGVVLAISGAAFLLAVWVAGRRADPLLR